MGPQQPLPDPDSDDARWMTEALAEARAALAQGEVPVGAVLVREGRLLGRGRNRTRALADPTAHAELLAVRGAAAALGDWRIGGTLYVTLEPCAMCAGAIVLARVERVVFAARDPKAGMAVSLGSLLTDPRLNHRCRLEEGVGSGEASALLSDFFRERREAGCDAARP
jgi:tRNA(adenine34) deaminase